MSAPVVALNYPNNLGRIILLALEEVAGRNGINAVLNFASMSVLIGNYPPADSNLKFPFDSIGLLQDSLEKLFGPHGGRGLALRAGRVGFAYVLREYGDQLGLMDTEFRLLPLGSKLSKTAQALASLFNNNTDQYVRLENHNEMILWHVERCPFCWGRTCEDVVCHFMTGFLQEAFYAMSGGKIFDVVEEACVAQGNPACIIRVKLEPLA